jgi:hypothetical protein
LCPPLYSVIFEMSVIFYLLSFLRRCGIMQKNHPAAVPQGERIK